MVCAVSQAAVTQAFSLSKGQWISVRSMGSKPTGSTDIEVQNNQGCRETMFQNKTKQTSKNNNNKNPETITTKEVLVVSLNIRKLCSRL